jgi:ribosomal protein S18 acetylase RimI-like enzyme
MLGQQEEIRMVVDNKGLIIDIRQLKGADEVHLISEFMATAEPWATLKRTYEDSVRMLNDPMREVYVADAAGEIAGFTILQMKGAFVGYLQTVGVLPSWRNQGIGSRLIQFAEERIFSEAPNAFICVSAFNVGALRLYERLGYQVVGELSDYIIPGHSEILMRKSIAPLTEFKPAEGS